MAYKNLRFGVFFMKDKELVIPREKNNKDSSFFKHFVREYNGRKYVHAEKYEELLINLEAMDKEYYTKWYKEFNTIYVNLGISSIGFLTEISKKQENYYLIPQMKKVYQKYMSLIDRCVGVRVNGTTVSNSKEEIVNELNDFIDKQKNTNTYALNINTSIKEQYKEELENLYLKKYVVELLRNIDDKLIDEAESRISKVEYDETGITYATLNGIVAIDNYKSQKRKRIGPYKITTI